MVPTLQGSDLLVQKSSVGGVTVNNANVVVADVAASNGVVHVIDSVLIPPVTAAPVPSIVERAVATPALSTLVSVLTAPGYEGLLAALGAPGTYTVFAPTNDALAAAGVDIRDVAAVSEVLKYHVVPNVAAFARDLQGVQMVPSLQGSNLLIQKSAAGVTVNNANVVVADVAASNGVVHVIDSVLIPPVTAAPVPSIVERAVATPALSTLVSVLTAPGYEGLLAALGAPGTYTVFAPTNEALAAAGVDIRDVAAVSDVLKYHVVPNVAAFAKDLQGVH